ncbi:hypothetical protein HN588_12615 [Candidatus Bathyarchaeota archaeon]|jgi:hypothetical protein|nr:hypothetical protein [Candidatus Bathyarchaeota archaeon]
MKIEEYREYLQGQGIPSDAIEKQITIIGDFARSFTDLGLIETIATDRKEAVEKFARQLIADGRNTPGNFSLLSDYADWLGHRKLYIALIELMDCHNAMEVLADEIAARYGQDVYERIFRETLPPLGANEKERCAYTRMIMERMVQQITPEEARAAWYQVQHGIPADVWRQNDMADREKYRQCGSIDEFIDLKRRERDTLLTRLRDEDKLWYTVVINDEVLAYIKGDLEMEGGRREGNKIFITKVPYNAIRYLHATDAKMKRYYACHCPLVREAILQDQPISPDVCNCSLGHASHYLAGLDLELKGEVIESAVKGDTRCRFVFYLPN